MNKRLLILFITALSIMSCNIYKPYSRQEVKTDSLYGEDVPTVDSTSLGTMKWKEVFTDPILQSLIERGIKNNTNLAEARLGVEQARAALSNARLNLLPTLALTPEASATSFDHSKAVQTYNLPIVSSWQIDIFKKLGNKKLQAKAVYLQTKEYQQAVQTSLVANIANAYYTLLMLDEQYSITRKTYTNLNQTLEMTKALMDAGKSNQAAVSQIQAQCYSVNAAMEDFKKSISDVEGSLSVVLKETPHKIERGNIKDIVLPNEFSLGFPIQLLSNRPDVRASEYNLQQYYYGLNVARASFYPTINLSGSAGWTNNAGAMILNPGKLLASALGSLTQPLFNGGALRANLKVAQSQFKGAQLQFEQKLLDAGNEVNTYYTQCQNAQKKLILRKKQVKSLRKALKSAKLLMENSNSTYLSVLTAYNTLLSAQTSEVYDWFEGVQGVVNLYQALGGGQN